MTSFEAPHQGLANWTELKRGAILTSRHRLARTWEHTGEWQLAGRRFDLNLPRPAETGAVSWRSAEIRDQFQVYFRRISHGPHDPFVVR